MCASSVWSLRTSRATKSAVRSITLSRWANPTASPDGTLLPEADPGNYQLIEKLVETLIAVEDDDIRKAIVATLQTGKLLIEPSAAMGIAAAMAGNLPVKAG